MTHQSRFCDGIARRDFLHLGVAGFFGMGSACRTCSQAQTAAKAAGKTDEGRLAHLPLPARRPQHHRHLRPEARRPRRVPRRVQADRHQRPRHPDLRAPAAGRPADGQVLADPLVPPPQLGPRPGRPLHAHRLLPAGRLQPEPEAEQPAAVLTAPSSPASSGRAARVPPYVCLPKMHPSCGSAYLGAAAAPFVIDADPNAPNFSVPDIVPPPAIAARPPRRPHASCSPTSTASSKSGRGAGQPAGPDRRRVPAQGVRPDDLARGEEGVRHRRRAGQAPRRVRPQLARPVVPDGPAAGRGGRPLRHHRPQQLGHARRQLHDAQARRCCPARRGDLPTLFRDLADRGLLDTHAGAWSPASSAARRGSTRTRAAITGGRRSRSRWAAAASTAAGSSASRRPRRTPAERPVRPRRPLRHACITCMGIDPKDEFHTPDGRPVQIVNNGQGDRRVAVRRPPMLERHRRRPADASTRREPGATRAANHDPALHDRTCFFGVSARIASLRLRDCLGRLALCSFRRLHRPRQSAGRRRTSSRPAASAAPTVNVRVGGLFLHKRCLRDVGPGVEATPLEAHADHSGSRGRCCRCPIRSSGGLPAGHGRPGPHRRRRPARRTALRVWTSQGATPAPAVRRRRSARDRRGRDRRRPGPGRGQLPVTSTAASFRARTSTLVVRGEEGPDDHLRGQRRPPRLAARRAARSPRPAGPAASPRTTTPSAPTRSCASPPRPTASTRSASTTSTSAAARPTSIA